MSTSNNSKAPTSNVAEYFAWCFGRPLHRRVEMAATFRLSSECGRDCKSAMNAAMALIGHVRMAHGDSSHEEQTIADMVEEVIEVYMYG